MSFKRLGSLLQLDAQAGDTNEQFLMTQQMQRGKDQVEYYLSGTNLEKDKFFHDLTVKNPDRWIDVSVFMGCQRIIQTGINSDDLLLACSKSHFLDVDAEKQTIRSKNPFVSDVRRKFRTMRMTGFPNDSTVDTIYDFLLANTAEPENVFLQYARNDDNDQFFTGTANVIYYTEYAAEATLSTPLLYKEKKISVERITDYENRRKKYEKKSSK